MKYSKLQYELKEMKDAKNFYEKQSENYRLRINNKREINLQQEQQEIQLRKKIFDLKNY